MAQIMLNRVLFTIEEITTKINAGTHLLLAGDEQILKQLPSGNWIGGTIPYFMSENGGLSTKNRIYVTEIPDYALDVQYQTYNEQTISKIYTNIPENGFSVIIIPAFSQTHLSFAVNAPSYENFAVHPLIGWISGLDLNDLENAKPKVFNGKTKEIMENNAVVMHITLPSSKYAEIGILNIFKQGKGDNIVFLEDGFSAKEAYINAVKKNFQEYILENNINIQLPLVANYYGAMINISIQNIDKKNKKVDFYAPVFKGVEYRQAENVGDYVGQFLNHIPSIDTSKIAFSCNCILNYMYSKLEGKKTAGITGPMTFGEVAYQLLNQTMVYISINDLEEDSITESTS